MSGDVNSSSKNVLYFFLWTGNKHQLKSVTRKLASTVNIADTCHLVITVYYEQQIVLSYLQFKAAKIVRCGLR